MTTKICDYIPKGKEDEKYRCNQEIEWNDNGLFYETVEYPGFQHNHRLVCNACGGDMFFSKLAPNSPQTGKMQPLDLPVPVDKKWTLHAHKRTAPAVQPQLSNDPLDPIPSTPGAVEGQSIPKSAPAEKDDHGNEAALDYSKALTVGQPDLRVLVDQLRFLKSEVEMVGNYQIKTIQPLIEDMVTWFKVIRPNIEVIAGRIVANSIKTADDIYAHNEQKANESGDQS